MALTFAGTMGDGASGFTPFARAMVKQFSPTKGSDASLSCKEGDNDLLLTTLRARSQTTVKIYRLDDELVWSSATMFAN
jgi:hypothetical protein